jgi:hypothetical protein
VDEMDSVPSVREETRGFAHREEKQRASLYIPACISKRQGAKGEERERDTTSASALKSSWDVHYREVTG